MHPQTSCLMLLALISTVSVSGQVDPHTTSKGVREVWSENLYVRSLSKCAEAQASETPTSNSVIVLKSGVLGDLFPVQMLPSRIGSFTIEYLTGEAVMKRYRRVRQRFPILEIKPLAPLVAT
jgi:hypothetical protein